MRNNIIILFTILSLSSLCQTSSDSRVLNYSDSAVAKAGSCASPDGPMKVTTNESLDYQWLQDNGYCNPKSYGKTPTVCWTFTPTTDSVDINSGWAGQGCAVYSFGSFRLFSPACVQIGTGLSFGNLLPGTQYSFCMSASTTGGGPGCIGFTDFCPYYYERGTIPLPIKLIEFKGKESVDGSIFLWWTTGSEQNNSYFTIESTEDGNLFKRISNIPGQGNSYQKSFYFYIDKNSVNGINYYRLRQTDYDGKYTYSNIIAIEVELEKVNNNGKILYYDILGRIVDRKVSILYMDNK